MRERIVVSFHAKLVSMRDDELSSWLDLSRRIREHAKALGATLCAFTGNSFSFELLPNSLEEALVLVAQACDEVAKGPGGPAIGIGISQGVIFPVDENEPLGWLAAGAPLVMSSALASIARPSEVLVDEALPAAEHREIPTCGMSAGADGELRVRGLVLDPLYVPTLVSPTLEAPPPSAARPSVLPSQSSGPERRQGMEALSNGDVAEALTALQKGVEKTKSAPPEERARALLAHGIALAATGREGEALLEVLEALGQAREAEDARGEEACARFLAKLTEAAGHPEVALTWKQVAEASG